MPDVELNRTIGSDSVVIDRNNYGTIITESQDIIDALGETIFHNIGTINKVVIDWKNNGVWDKLDGLWIFADGQYINWKTPGTYDATANGTIHKIKWNGIKSDETTGYLNLNYNPKLDGVNFTTNNASFGFYCLHGDRSGSSRIMGGNDGTEYLTVSPQSSMILRFNTILARLVVQAHTNDVLGLWTFNRTSANDVEWWIGDTKEDDFILLATDAPNCDMYAMAYNNNGVTAYYNKNVVGMVCFGGSFTKSNISALKTGMDYIISHQKRLNTDDNIDVFTDLEGHISYQNSAYRSGTDIYEVWWETTGKGDTTRAAMIRTISDIGIISDSYRVGGSVVGANDAHLVPYITIDNNGYIYVSKELGNPTHISPVQVFKSDSPLSISGGFTRINLFNGDFSYPQMLKTGDDIIMVARSSANRIKVWKKGLTDSAFSEVGDLCIDTDGRLYPYTIRNVNEDEIWITAQVNTIDPGNAKKNFTKIYVLRSTDGETWGNVDESFSKNISVAGQISQAELEANCLLIQVANPNVRFCSGGFIDTDGLPKLLIEEATQNVLSGWRDTDTLATYHYDGGWVRRVARSGLSLVSRHDNYMHNATYITYNDSEYIIFSYQDGDNTILEKWVSTDFVNWVKDFDWLNGTGLKFAWPNNDVQNAHRVGDNLLFTARFDPNFADNIDGMCIENLKRF